MVGKHETRKVARGEDMEGGNKECCKKTPHQDLVIAEPLGLATPDFYYKYKQHLVILTSFVILRNCRESGE
jgi:hypothetical protein